MIYVFIMILVKFDLFLEQWQFKVIVEMNDYQFKLVWLQGDFVWYSYVDIDEIFIVLYGQFWIDFCDGVVELKVGDMFVVFKGKEYKFYVVIEVQVMLIELCGVVNIGDFVVGECIVLNDVWV